ncbi:MAG: hypothetical protein KKF33_20370 [Alphaproteobacteria bacterium]|nr:hypothetical protein [Alphaproteobacteria bacterium]
MEADSMACDCGGKWEFKDGYLLCASCGKKSPFQPVASHGELITQNKRMADKIYTIKAIVEGTLPLANKLAEIELILEDD